MGWRRARAAPNQNVCPMIVSEEIGMKRKGWKGRTEPDATGDASLGLLLLLHHLLLFRWSLVGCVGTPPAYVICPSVPPLAVLFLHCSVRGRLFCSSVSVIYFLQLLLGLFFMCSRKTVCLLTDEEAFLSGIQPGGGVPTVAFEPIHHQCSDQTGGLLCHCLSPRGLRPFRSYIFISSVHLPVSGLQFCCAVHFSGLDSFLLRAQKWWKEEWVERLGRSRSVSSAFQDCGEDLDSFFRLSSMP